jgi:hypothetical protein
MLIPFTCGDSLFWYKENAGEMTMTNALLLIPLLTIKEKAVETERN